MGVVVLVLLLDQPVLDSGSGLTGISTLLAFDLDGHALVLLERRSQVGFLGRLGGLGLVECEDLALSVRVLDGWCLVGLEFFQVEFLDEVGCDEADAKLALTVLSFVAFGLVWHWKVVDDVGLCARPRES